MAQDAVTPLNYVEITSPELEETQAFLAKAFGWTFVDYGDDYRDIDNAGVAGGVERGALRPPLPVLKTDDLEKTLARVRAAGAEITKDIFDFPGGRRIIIQEPGGNEMAVWSE